jgi:rhodanese-related sulfurtransferase
MANSKTKKILISSIVIILAASVIGILINLMNPGGLGFKEKPVSEDSGTGYNLAGFRNDPYDTSDAKMPTALGYKEKNRQGIYEPVKITYKLAKQFYDINALFIDGRAEADYKAGHIKGAINFPYMEFFKMSQEKKIELTRRFNKNGIIVAYCSGGKCEVSIDIAYELARLGFTSVNIYLGGYSEWEKNGYPVEK